MLFEELIHQMRTYTKRIEVRDVMHNVGNSFCENLPPTACSPEYVGMWLMSRPLTAGT